MSRKVFDVLVYFLGGALLIDVLGIIALLGFDRPVDDILKQIATGLVTGLLGLMVRAPGDDDPMPVVIQEQPISTEQIERPEPVKTTKKAAKHG